MRPFFRSLVLSLAVLAGAAGVSSACINDREVEIHERQFKSDYQQTKPTPSPSSSDLVPGSLVLTVGIGLLIGAGLIVRQTLKYR